MHNRLHGDIWSLSHFWPLVRDSERLTQTKDRTAVLPLGSAALAGTAFPVDRNYLAEQLGFNSISKNSLDAVSDRDFVADFLYGCDDDRVAPQSYFRTAHHLQQRRV